MKRVMSENRSMTESQNPPNGVSRPISRATLPSMKSKMLATIITTPAHRNRRVAEQLGGDDVDEDPGEREPLGWMRSATQSRMIPRSGYMQAVPIAPVNVIASL